MTRKFTFIKQETVEYEIEVEAENYKEALEEYMAVIEEGDYSLHPSDQLNSVSYVCCELCGEQIEADDAHNYRINAGTKFEQIVCNSCVQDMQNEGSFIYCRQCCEFYEPELLRPDAAGECCVCPNCGENAYKED